jgi:hypothetical protein
LEFFEKLYFWGFSEIDKSLKTQENDDGTMENKFKTKSTEVLRH